MSRMYMGPRTNPSGYPGQVSGKHQAPAGNSGGYAPAPGMGGGMPAAPMPASPTGGMPMPPAGGGFGAGGGSVDTGGLPSGPEGGAGGGPTPFHFNPITNTTNIDKSRNYDNSYSSYHGGNRSTANDYSRTWNKNNIDNSQTTMAARGGQQRQKIERMRPFKQKDYGMGEQMIGDPGLAMQQLKMMNSLMGLG